LGISRHSIRDLAIHIQYTNTVASQKKKNRSASVLKLTVKYRRETAWACALGREGGHEYESQSIGKPLVEGKALPVGTSTRKTATCQCPHEGGGQEDLEDYEGSVSDAHQSD
jgi:hypothetical protein